VAQDIIRFSSAKSENKKQAHQLHTAWPYINWLCTIAKFILLQMPFTLILPQTNIKNAKPPIKVCLKFKW
jgi:hypothetical protein